LTNRSSNLRPEQIDLIVQSLQSKDFELGIWLRKKADQAGCRYKSNHGEVFEMPRIESENQQNKLVSWKESSGSEEGGKG
jgi:hypothetical protein